MYIEFTLPSGAAGQAAAHRAYYVKLAVKQWADKHQIWYETKIVKYTLRVVFDNDDLCNFFALSFESKYPYRIVNPLNNLT